MAGAAGRAGLPCTGCGDYELADDYDATRLYHDCVRRVRPGWQPSAEERQTIAGICRALEGMPLGIELAAAWTRSLPLAQVGDELERGLSILSTSLRDVPARHRSMSAVFDQSWQMLGSDERSVLRQMSVFRGGCTLAAAQAVTGAGLAQLATLVDGSWLRLRANGRYDMHELVRQYCAQKLAIEHKQQIGEEPANVSERHCRFFGDYMSKMVPSVNFETNVKNDISTELPNITSSWLFATESGCPKIANDFAVAVQFVGDMMGWYGPTITLLEQGETRLEQRLTQPELDPHSSDAIREALGCIYNPIFMMRLMHLGLISDARNFIQAPKELAESFIQREIGFFWKALHLYQIQCLLYREGESDASITVGQDALKAFQDPDFVCPFFDAQRGPLYWQAHVYWRLGQCSWRTGDYDGAERNFTLAITLRDRAGEKRYKGSQMESYAGCLLIIGNYRRARELSHIGLQLSQATGDSIGVARGYLSIGRVKTVTQNTKSAQSHLLHSLSYGKRTGHLKLQMESLTELGKGALYEGRIDDARHHFMDALDTFQLLNEPYTNYLAGVQLGLGWSALAERDTPSAAEMFCKVIASGKGAAWEKMEAIAGLAEVAAQEGRREEAVELLSLVAAHPFTAHAQRQQSQQSLAALQHDMAPDLFAQRVDAGARLELDATLANLANVIGL